jgi:hypothetical protein
MREGITLQEGASSDAEVVESTADRKFVLTSVPWLSNATAILTVVGVIIYGLLNVGYSAFYQQFGISPDEVGLGYFGTLARSTGLVLIILSAALLATASYVSLIIARHARERLYLTVRAAELASLAVWLKASNAKNQEAEPSKGAQQSTADDALTNAIKWHLDMAARESVTARESARASWLRALTPVEGAPADRTYARTMARLVALLATIALIALLVIAVRGTCITRAESVQTGHPVAPISLLGLSLLAIHADPATVSPVGEAGQSAGLDALSGRTMMYLGQANGAVVLYDAQNQRTITLPASSVVLQIAK